MLAKRDRPSPVVDDQIGWYLILIPAVMMCLKIDTAVTTDNPYDDSHINVYFPLTKIWSYI